MYSGFTHRTQETGFLRGFFGDKPVISRRSLVYESKRLNIVPLRSIHWQIPLRSLTRVPNDLVTVDRPLSYPVAIAGEKRAPRSQK
ncbi:hypothetical protein QUA40_04780 [Microcoleus sp. Pol11C3]|uniref:hypothetical protein n=1 Tax=Microcoleus sp. Pol11C3 TaxID=3055390 RepID=UPI002FD20696